MARFVSELFLSMVFLVLLAFPIEWMVNGLFTPAALLFVFGVAKIGWGQALALSILAEFFTSGIRVSTRVE
jgi:hypothetical protein